MSLSAFLKENALPVAHETMVVSKRFVNEKGQPEAWEIRAISGTEDEAIRKSCTKRVQIPGKRGQYTQETDFNAYVAKLCTACTVYPNLNDKELQDNYGVMGAEDLLKAMLLSGEYTAYAARVQEICGFDTTLQDEVDEAKN